jgi:hypothetical protein
MDEYDIVEQCEQLALLRYEITSLKKLEKELSQNIKDAIGGRGIIRDADGRRVCKVSSRRNPRLGTRLKFFKPWLRDVIH